MSNTAALENGIAEEKKSTIQYIDVNKITSHPDNPRKELGDLSELAESIKANGILQNLTVVPRIGEVTHKPVDGIYRVVIGHRRLAAAKLAGLKTVPCIISNMGYKEQVSTMLLENMQRSDLSVYEQAQGFQMMLNLGETVSGISKQTGFSDSTVRRRVKLLELDQEKLKKSAARGGTLQDYMELDKIEDIKLRNSVLEKVGTANFNYELRRALDKEKSDKIMSKIIAEIEKFATKIDSPKKINTLQWIKSYYPSNNAEVEVPKDAKTTKYFYFASSYSVTVYKKGKRISNAEKEKQKEVENRCAALDEITKRAYELRFEFMKKFTGAKKHISDLIEYAIRNAIDSYDAINCEIFTNILGLKFDDNQWELEDVVKKTSVPLETIFAVAVYSMLDEPGLHYYSWDGSYADEDQLDLVYDFLKRLGYEISDEEQALKDGTHKLFNPVSGI